MITHRRICISLLCVLVPWFVYVSLMYGLHRRQMRAIGEELGMPQLTWYTVGEPLTPLDRVAGDERMLIVGKGPSNYVLASIVRNTAFSDFRGQWKVDYCTGGDPNVENGRLIFWSPHENFPTERDIARFRQIAATKRFVVWDTPEGTNP